MSGRGFHAEACSQAPEGLWTALQGCAQGRWERTILPAQPSRPHHSNPSTGSSKPPSVGAGSLLPPPPRAGRAHCPYLGHLHPVSCHLSHPHNPRPHSHSQQVGQMWPLQPLSHPITPAMAAECGEGPGLPDTGGGYNSLYHPHQMGFLGSPRDNELGPTCSGFPARLGPPGCGHLTLHPHFPLS